MNHKSIHIIILNISLISFGFSITLQVPEDYITIQQAIDASADGDTVLVNNGDYYENLIVDKSIVITSYAVFDNLDDWIEEDQISGEWFVSNANIQNTRLIGSNPQDSDYGSVIIIAPSSNECISPEISGFTIQDGSGTYVLTNNEAGEIISVILGAGILADVSIPYIHHNQFLDNGTDQVFSGGGMNIASDAEDFSFDNRYLSNFEPRCDIGEYQINNNLFNGNQALYGNSVANNEHEDGFNMSGSVFDCYNCLDQVNNVVSSAWIDVGQESSVDYSGIQGNFCGITDADVYVDSNIAQECENYVDCGSENNPFKTINKALEMILPSPDNPINIHLASGYYSPSTGENFPIIPLDYVNIIGNFNGENPENNTSVIDAMQEDQVFKLSYNIGNSFENLTITGGIKTNNYVIFILGQGGGMEMVYSNPIIKNTSIEYNKASTGAGMYIFESYPILSNVVIKNNQTYDYFDDGSINLDGGGLYIARSSPVIYNSKIFNNTADRGAGIYSLASPFNLNNTILNNNTANNYGGGILIESYVNSSIDAPLLNHVVITDNNAPGGSGLFLNTGTANLMNSIVWNDAIGINQSDFYGATAELNVSYSNTSNIFEGNGNISSNPLFDSNFNLQQGSPCINSGNPNSWYNDTDGTRSDMGIYGGSGVIPSFTNYSFNDVGDIDISVEFDLLNLRDYPIIIENVQSSTAYFYSNTNFPNEISPLSKGFIDISTNNVPNSGLIEGTLSIISNNLFENTNIKLSLNSVSGNVLSGNLPETVFKNTYLISNNISVAQDDIVTIQPGTKFLFDGSYSFNVEGELIAIGTEQNNIVFESSATNSSWQGLRLMGTTDETHLEHIRISNVGEGDAVLQAPLSISSSNHSIIKNILINENEVSGNCGGISISGSSIIAEDIAIIDNFSTTMVMVDQSNVVLNRFLIRDNNLESGLFGSFLINLNEAGTSVLSNFTITNNDLGGSLFGGGALFTAIDNLSSNISPAMYNSIVWNNPGLTNFKTLLSITNMTANFSDISLDNENEQLLGESNINADPLFQNPNNNDFTLQNNSPCINTGTADWFSNGNIDITYYDGPSPDMGTYEYICPTFTDECGVCGGNNSACLDCFGVINGNAIEDCAGTCDGAAIEDDLGNCCNSSDISLCGVCFGSDNDCMDCNGNIAGPYELDECGVCNGNNCCWDRPANLIGEYEFDSWFIYDLSCNTFIGDQTNFAMFSKLELYSDGLSMQELRIDEFLLENFFGMQGGCSSNSDCEQFATFYICPNDDDPDMMTDETMCNAFCNLPCNAQQTDFSSAICDLPSNSCYNQSEGYWGVLNDQFLFFNPLLGNLLTSNYDFEGWPDNTLTLIEPDEDNGECYKQIYTKIGTLPNNGVCEDNPLSNEDTENPGQYHLRKPYPNPFNPNTTIEFSVPEYSYISIQIYDIKGRLVSSLANNYYNPGLHTINWNAKDFSSGAYFIKMISKNYTQTDKVMLIK